MNCPSALEAEPSGFHTCTGRIDHVGRHSCHCGMTWAEGKKATWVMPDWMAYVLEER